MRRCGQNLLGTPCNVKTIQFQTEKNVSLNSFVENLKTRLVILSNVKSYEQVANNHTLIYVNVNAKNQQDGVNSDNFNTGKCNCRQQSEAIKLLI